MGWGSSVLAKFYDFYASSPRGENVREWEAGEGQEWEEASGEILLAVLVQLASVGHPRDLCAASSVSRRWHQLATDNAVWKMALKGPALAGKLHDTVNGMLKRHGDLPVIHAISAYVIGQKDRDRRYNRSVQVMRGMMSTERQQRHALCTVPSVLHVYGYRSSVDRHDPYQTGKNPSIHDDHILKVHPDKYEHLVVQFSVDLVSASAALELLLRKIDVIRSQFLGNRSRMSQALVQYKRFLRLQAKSTTRLIPTLDIEMVWLSHLLRPEAYERDCRTLFGHIIDHSLVMESDDVGLKPGLLSYTQALWQDEYGEPYLPSQRSKDAQSPELSVHELLRRKHPELFAKKEAAPPPKDRMTAYFCRGDVKEPDDIIDSQDLKKGAANALGLPLESLNCWYVEDQSNLDAAGEPQDMEIGLTEEDVIKDTEWLGLFDSYMKGMHVLWKVTPTGMSFVPGSMAYSYHYVLPKAYERFLYLWAKHVLKPTLPSDRDPSAQPAKGRCAKKRLSSGGLAPTPAIDLAWHAHMIHPIAYRQECERLLLGHVLHHEPWPLGKAVDEATADGVEEERMKWADSLWRSEFGVPIDDEHKLL